MKVKVAVPGKYMNKEKKAVKCQEGAILETLGWYGSDMIAEGLAVEADKPTPAEIEAEKKRKAAERRKAAKEKKKAEEAAKKAAQAGKTKNPGEVFMQ